ARGGAIHHAGGADHPLRQPGPGDSLPGGRVGDRLAAIAGHPRHRRAVLPRRAGALSQDPGADGLRAAAPAFWRSGFSRDASVRAAARSSRLKSLLQVRAIAALNGLVRESCMWAVSKSLRLKSRLQGFVQVLTYGWAIRLVNSRSSTSG